MLRYLRNSTILQFTLIFLLPILVFSVYEYGSLRENEEVIESIYNNQLDAILFSVNQYAEDAMSDWANDLVNIQNSDQPAMQEALSVIPGCVGLARFDRAGVLQESWILRDSVEFPKAELSAVLARRDSTLVRLATYLRGNYRKITLLPQVIPDLEHVLYAHGTDSLVFFDVLLIEPKQFIRQFLDPKIQEIARDKFYITARKIETQEEIYSSEKAYDSGDTQFHKALWLMPDYELGIEMKNVTIRSLAMDRSKKDLLMVLVIDIILVAGLILLFRNMRKQIRLSQLKTDFVSNVSHEIRTPLALISMYIESLEMGRVKSSEKVQEYYHIILQETRRLTTIVNKILNFSQIENDKKRYAFSEGNLNEILCNIHDTYKFNLEQRGFKVMLSTDPDLPDILVDEEAAADALVNLIDNAVKYSGDSKEIHLQTGQKGPWVFAEVSDKGIGISDEDQKLVYDKFFRVTEKNLALKAKGSGLGLSIVKHIIDAHQGKIELSSAVGKGSAFRLLFPKKQENHEKNSDRRR